ncbi:conserved Plasmodium protein, unknown function [Plasmodium chabaudi chabaudi]|uniref:Uncharacterized protein n=1 Tax=Plasmodium chabaudi chabaudi TaxID=31271 RepID=A0A4V0K2S6_PLACU|nr:conserved Plasmodium protein, unknown function [Plasmodium chabaudi chabaudi]VTZ67164.1 conserved Plasmodium protein, unknown function [Plasmodium chabaudi chabaudi]|eukprot:XP_744874.2 conserved Plasmodium protein, unknown function [Plasmodium chabaudi chabaudi]
MQKFSKYACNKIVNIGNTKGKQIINIYVHNIILGYYLIQNNYYTKWKYAIVHFKNFNLLKDYMNERDAPHTFTNQIEHQKGKHTTNKQSIFYNKESRTYDIIVNPVIYSQLKNVLRIIHKTNNSILQNILTKYKNVIPLYPDQIIKSNISIHKNEYLFYLQIPNKYINIILPDIRLQFKKENTSELFKQINNLDIYALISFFHIHTNAIKNVTNTPTNYDSTDGGEAYGLISASLSDDMTNFILNNLCVQIDKIFSNFKSKETTTTMNKLDFHKIYLDLLDMLTILIVDINKNIKFIDFILNTLLKSFYKYKHHYNYTYSVNLLNTINQILPFHIHSLYLPSAHEEDISNDFVNKIENNYFYIQKENFTWNHINKYYAEISSTNSATEIENEKKIMLHSLNTECLSNTFVPLNQSIDNNKFWAQYCIILVTIIVKKIKYVTHRNVLTDEQYVLEAINTLLHIQNKKVLNLDSLIDSKAPFLKDLHIDKLENSKGTDIDIPNKYECSEKKNNFLLFLNFSFNMLKNLKYNNTCLKDLASKNKEGVKTFLKIISLISNIKYLLTSNIKKCASKNSMENVITANDHFIKRQNEDIKNTKIINMIKKNINLFGNEIVLAFSNYYAISKSFSSDFLSCTSQKNIAMYMSYIFNDAYFQNNSQIKSIILNHFLKHYNILNSNLETYNKKYIYLQYITIYNFIKLFHNDINNTSPDLYNTILNIFMECFNNNTCYNLKNGKNSNDVSYTNEQNNYYLHLLNKLCYVYFLSKKYITNLEFLNHINHNFYLTFYLINQYIEKNINPQEYFTNFINKCANKIIIILTVHKFFNIYSEDLNVCVSKLIQLTHEYITKENKEKFILYIIPFLKLQKSSTDSLKRLLIDANTNVGEEVNIQKDTPEESQLTFQNYNLSNSNQGDISCIECEKNESNLFKDDLKVGNNTENDNIHNDSLFTNKQNSLSNIFFNYFKEHNYANQNVYPVSPIENDLIELIDNLEKNKNFQITNSTLCQILNEYVKENKLIKKENAILKNKLNFIVLNFEQFISSYINSISGNNSTTSIPTNNSTIFDCKENINTINTLIMNKSGKTVEKDINKNKIGEKDIIQEETNYYKFDRDNVNKIKNVSTTLQIQFDYHYVNAKNEYFHELKKYECKNYIKVNNILLNMYMYNPYISAKNNKKKLIILPYDTYKNIKKLVCEGNEGANVFKRFHNSVYFFFDKLMIFFCKTRN